MTGYHDTHRVVPHGSTHRLGRYPGSTVKPRQLPGNGPVGNHLPVRNLLQQAPNRLPEGGYRPTAAEVPARDSRLRNSGRATHTSGQRPGAKPGYCRATEERGNTSARRTTAPSDTPRRRPSSSAPAGRGIHFYSGNSPSHLYKNDKLPGVSSVREPVIEISNDYITRHYPVPAAEPVVRRPVSPIPQQARQPVPRQPVARSP